MKHPLLRLIDRVYPEAVAVRRALHAHPELSGAEFKTARFIYEYLGGLGLTPRYYVGKTGVAARIVNGNGKTVALRADTDALPLQEKNTASFVSVTNGVMHACGHDMHTACLLSALSVLVRMKNSWKGTVVALFQPSEEKAPGGALRMIAEKAFPEHADAVIGLHVSIDHAVGEIGLKPGRDYSGVLDFFVTITGSGGHGAAPHRVIDPIVCSCCIIMELQTLVSRETPADEPSVVTVGSLHAGTKNNIIPDEAFFSGTIRTFSEKHATLLRRRFIEIATSVARSFNAAAKVTFEKSYPPGWNDAKLTKRAACVMSGLLGKRSVVLRRTPTMFAEDFAYYQKKSPGAFRAPRSAQSRKEKRGDTLRPFFPR